MPFRRPSGEKMLKKNNAKKPKRGQKLGRSAYLLGLINGYSCG